MAETEEEEEEKKKKKKKVVKKKKKKKKKKKVTPKQTPKVTSQNKGAKVTKDIKPLEERDWLKKFFGSTAEEDAKAHEENKRRFAEEEARKKREEEERQEFYRKATDKAEEKRRTPFGFSEQGEDYSSDYNKNKGGYVKKYAHGGGVRKTKISDY